LRFTHQWAAGTLLDKPAVLNEEALVAWGEAIGRHAEAPLVIALRGDLGAGKSTLARAIARGAGVRGSIPSPTYNLLLRYGAERDREVVHVDLFRIERVEEAHALGWSDLPAEDEILLIEWPERLESLLPEPRWEISLVEAGDPSLREISLLAIGAPGPLAEPVRKREA
jgi:tRNA threonylcarbamoyladenosine biosynthesis protein TsaE